MLKEFMTSRFRYFFKNESTGLWGWYVDIKTYNNNSKRTEKYKYNVIKIFFSISEYISLYSDIMCFNRSQTVVTPFKGRLWCHGYLLQTQKQPKKVRQRGLSYKQIVKTEYPKNIPINPKI